MIRLIATALLLPVICIIQPIRLEAAPSARHWVYFKPNPSSTIASTQEWPERSLLRRAKSNRQLDAFDQSIPEEYLEAITALGADVTVSSKWLQAISVTADPDQLKGITALDFVESVEPVRTLQRDRIEIEPDAVTERLKPLNSAGAYGNSFRQAELAGVIGLHARGLSGRCVLLGMIDTGFQLDHIAFAGLDVVAQYDFINDDPDPSYDPATDSQSQPRHGTGCLSVIVGNVPGKLIGIAPGVSVALAKTEDTGSETEIEEDYWIAAIEWFEWLGVDVVSSSLTYRDWYRAEEMDGRAPIARAAKRAADLGMVICISAGNAGPGDITIGAPADAEGLLAVAAIDSSGRITRFSSRGPSADGRVKPDIAAMGRAVVCVRPMTFDLFSRWNGTSLACPIVAGVAALILEAHPDWSGQKVVTAIRETGSQVWNPDPVYGYGIIDGEAACDYPSISFTSSRQEFSITLTGENGEILTRNSESGQIRFVNLGAGNYTWKTGGDALQTGTVFVPSSAIQFIDLP